MPMLPPSQPGLVDACMVWQLAAHDECIPFNASQEHNKAAASSEGKAGWEYRVAHASAPRRAGHADQGPAGFTGRCRLGPNQSQEVRTRGGLQVENEPPGSINR
jgi:hypothetical protein